MDAPTVQVASQIDWTKVGAIANCLIAVGTLASVVVILRSIRGVRRTLEGNAYQAIHTMMTNIHITLMKDPNFRKILYGPPFRPSPDERHADAAALEAGAEMVIDLFDNIYCQMDVIPPHAFEGFDEYMRGVYARSTYLQEFLTDHADWYSDAFLQHIGYKPAASSASA